MYAVLSWKSLESSSCWLIHMCIKTYACHVITKQPWKFCVVVVKVIAVFHCKFDVFWPTLLLWSCKITCWEIVHMHYASFHPFDIGCLNHLCKKTALKVFYLEHFCSCQYFNDSFWKILHTQPMNFNLLNALLKSFTTFSHLTFSIFVHFLEKMAFKVVLSLNSLLACAEFSLFYGKIDFSRIFSQIYLQ